MKFVELYAESLCEEIVKRVELYVCSVCKELVPGMWTSVGEVGVGMWSFDNGSAQLLRRFKLIPVHTLPPTTFVQIGLEAGSNHSQSVSAMDLNPVESGGL